MQTRKPCAQRFIATSFDLGPVLAFVGGKKRVAHSTGQCRLLLTAFPGFRGHPAFTEKWGVVWP
jgi:hypothetical protein